MDWHNATEQNLLALVHNGDSESHYLDFKQRDALLANADGEKKRRLAEVSKDISSFAHADGGTIIYGMEEAGDPAVATRLRGFRSARLPSPTLP